MKTTHLNDSNFDQTLQGTSQPVLVDFHATWCGPCKMLGPVIDEIATEQDGKAVVAKVDVDDAPAISSRYGISSIPALIIFRDGKPVKSFVGLQPKAVLTAALAAAAAA